MKARFLAAGALALLCLAGCGDNSGDPAGFAPDGVSATSTLILDVQPATADSSQVWVFGDIYDATLANGYRLYLDPEDQGFRPASDYISAPTHTYSTGTNLYRIRSLTFDPSLTNTFVGRGIRNGVESRSGPLSERAYIFKTGAVLDLTRRLAVALASPADSANTDSTPTRSWTPTPGASRYRLHVTGRNGIVYEVIVDGTSHQVEGGGPGVLIEDIPMRGGFLYRWGVDAIDPQNRVIGITRTERALLVH